MINRTTLTWFVIGLLWSTLSLWLNFLVIKIKLSWHKNRGRNALLLLLRFHVLYIILYIIGYLLLTQGKPSSEDLVLGLSLPLMVVYFIIITGRLIRSIQPGSNKDVLANRLEGHNVIRNIKRQQRWWSLLQNYLIIIINMGAGEEEEKKRSMDRHP